MRKIPKQRLFVILMVFALLWSLVPITIGAAESEYSNLIVNTATKPSVGGHLQVITGDSGEKMLGDQNGDPIQLRGMSTHGLQWFPGIINVNAFAALANDWDSNLIRLALYVDEDGYATHPELKQKVINGIDYAIANDMYVIVDWHVHNPGDPNAGVYSGAQEFFKSISGLYPNNPHILYELANEPNGGNAPGVTNDAEGWSQVKRYAEPIIEQLRTDGNNNIVIVGSPNWSQRPDLAALDPIDDVNTVYTVHFYTGTHLPAAGSADRTNVMNNATFALENGVALFATEWGTSEASGNNGPFLDKADQWLDYLNGHNISWANWSLTNKAETSAAFIPLELGKTEATHLDPGEDQKWAPNELSISGEYVRARIKGIAYAPLDRTKEVFSTNVWDFDDGTTQGFGINNNSPITVSNVDNRLRITGLIADSTDYWATRISADNATARPDILGADKITMDVFASAPTPVSISAIPQSNTQGWASPSTAAEVTTSDYVEVSEGVYKAVITLEGTSAPNLANIASDSADSILTNLILMIASPNSSIIALDNITFSGVHTIVTQPIVHAPLGTATVPSDFEDLTRQGWNWAGDSGFKGALTVEDANGSKAISWNINYPDVKPTDNWASAPRLTLEKSDLTRGDKKYLDFDFYLNPERGAQGALTLNLVFGAPSLGYWAQHPNNVIVPLTVLSQQEKTPDGLYHYNASFDLDMINGVTAMTELGKIIIIVADDKSDFAGRMYIDNVRFANHVPAKVVPSAPTGLVATGGDSQVSLNWDTVTGATYYKVKRSTTLGGSYTTITDEVLGTTYTDSHLTNGTTYYYVVSAANSDGESSNSESKPATPAGISDVRSESGNNNTGNAGNSTVTPPKTDAAILPQADKDGKITVEIAKGANKVILPANITIDNKSKIELKNDKVSLEIPGIVFKKLQSMITADELKDATISFKMEPLSPAERAALLDKAKEKSKADVMAAGEILNFTISIISKDGKERNLTQFEEPITLTLKINDNVKKELLGVYSIADDGTLEYVGGKLVDGKMIAQISHFSKYAVLSYDKSFADVSDSFWAAHVIKQMAAKHILQGVSETEFAPSKSVTRAEFTSLIVRTLDIKAKGMATFSDVSAADWFASDIAAANEVGIVKGRSDSKFDPNASISREEMVVMLMNAYEYTKGSKASAGNVNAFADQEGISSWAQAAVTTAQSLGFITGRNNNQFVPHGLTTRAESAQVVSKLIAE